MFLNIHLAVGQHLGTLVDPEHEQIPLREVNLITMVWWGRFWLTPIYTTLDAFECFCRRPCMLKQAKLNTFLQEGGAKLGTLSSWSFRRDLQKKTAVEPWWTSWLGLRWLEVAAWIYLVPPMLFNPASPQTFLPHSWLRTSNSVVQFWHPPSSTFSEGWRFLEP